MRFIYAALPWLLFIAGCSSSATVKDESSAEAKDVKKVITAFDSWLVDKDSKALKTIFTEETEAIVYNASSEVWKGAASIRKKMLKGIDKLEDVSVDIRDQDIKVVGSTAWFSERADFKFDYNGQRVNNEGVRMTGVLMKENGQWKIVQWHTSFPSRQAQEQNQQQQEE